MFIRMLVQGNLSLKNDINCSGEFFALAIEGEIKGLQ